MDLYKDQRPNPDLLLESIKTEEPKNQGRLKIFFGYAAGVGKTYAMLDDARDQKKNGVDVIVGYVEPHTRPETIQLLEGLPILPPKVLQYKNIQLKEFDLDAAIRRKPELILVDELAHTNAEGVRNKKRYQDIEELLNAGIDVYTTVNVQHIESLNDVVSDITKISVRETIPDYIFDHANKVRLIDIEPDELLRRFTEGKIYRPERAETAMNNFFTKENLRLLREIAMRKAIERISSVNQNERSMADKMASMKMIVCVSSSPSSAKCIRWTARNAEAQHAPWIAVYVERTDSNSLNDIQRKGLQSNLDLVERLGAEIVTLNGDDVAAVVAEYAKLTGITNITIGKGRNKKSLKNLFETNFEDKLISLLPTVEIHIIPDNITPLSSSSDSYSKRSASVGLTADARRAGISTAPTTPAARIQTAPAIVTGSVGLTSYSCDSTRRPSAQTHGKAIAIPAATIIFEMRHSGDACRVRRRSGIGCKVEQTTDPARRIGRRLSLQRLQ